MQRGRRAPIIPVIDGESKVQPIYVENTVDCIIRSLTDPKTTNWLFEIDNPTFQIPITFMWPAACILEGVMEKLTSSLPPKGDKNPGLRSFTFG